MTGFNHRFFFRYCFSICFLAYKSSDKKHGNGRCRPWITAASVVIIVLVELFLCAIQRTFFIWMLLNEVICLKAYWCTASGVLALCLVKCSSSASDWGLFSFFKPSKFFDKAASGIQVKAAHGSSENEMWGCFSCFNRHVVVTGTFL